MIFMNKIENSWIKIAVNIMLLRTDEIMDKAIEANQALLKTFDKKIVINKQNCLSTLHTIFL